MSTWQTAKQAFDELHEKCGALAERIQCHVANAPDDPRWDHVASLGHAVALLDKAEAAVRDLRGDP